MRRDDDVVALEDRMTGEGLLGEDVEGGPGNLARLEPVDERVEVDQLAAGAIDDPDALAHRGEIASASMQLTVSGVFGRCKVMKSERAVELLGSSTPSTPSSRKRSAVTNLS